MFYQALAWVMFMTNSLYHVLKAAKPSIRFTRTIGSPNPAPTRVIKRNNHDRITASWQVANQSPPSNIPGGGSQYQSYHNVTSTPASHNPSYSPSSIPSSIPSSSPSTNSPEIEIEGVTAAEGALDFHQSFNLSLVIIAIGLLLLFCFKNCSGKRLRSTQWLRKLYDICTEILRVDAAKPILPSQIYAIENLPDQVAEATHYPSSLSLDDFYQQYCCYEPPRASRRPRSAKCVEEDASRLPQLLMRISDLTKDCARANQKLEKAEERASSLKNELADTQKTMRLAGSWTGAEQDDAEAKILELQKRQKSSVLRQRRLLEAKWRAEEALRAVQVDDDDLAVVRGATQELQDKVSRLETELTAAHTRCSELESELEAGKTQTGLLIEDALTTARTATEGFQSQISGLQNKLTAAYSERSALEADLCAEKNKLGPSMDQLRATARQEAEELGNQISGLQNKVTAAHSKYSALESSLEAEKLHGKRELEDASMKAREESKQYKARISALEAKLKAKDSKLNDLDISLEKANQRCNGLQASLEGMVESEKETAAQMRKATSDLEQRLTDKSDKLRSAEKMLKSKRTSANQETDKILNDSREKMDGHLATISRLEAEIQAKDSWLMDMNARLENWGGHENVQGTKEIEDALDSYAASKQWFKDAFGQEHFSEVQRPSTFEGTAKSVIELELKMELARNFIKYALNTYAPFCSPFDDKTTEGEEIPVADFAFMNIAYGKEFMRENSMSYVRENVQRYGWELNHYKKGMQDQLECDAAGAGPDLSSWFGGPNMDPGLQDDHIDPSLQDDHFDLPSQDDHVVLEPSSQIHGAGMGTVAEANGAFMPPYTWQDNDPFAQFTHQYDEGLTLSDLQADSTVQSNFQCDDTALEPPLNAENATTQLQSAAPLPSAPIAVPAPSVPTAGSGELQCGEDGCVELDELEMRVDCYE